MKITQIIAAHSEHDVWSSLYRVEDGEKIYYVQEYVHSASLRVLSDDEVKEVSGSPELQSFILGVRTGITEYFPEEYPPERTARPKY